MRDEIQRMIAAADPIAAGELLDPALERAALGLGEAIIGEPRVGRAISRRRPVLDRPWARGLRFAVVLGLVALLAAGTLLTPTGRAVTSWVGDKIGLGEPGGHPTLHVMRTRSDVGTSAEGRPAWVLAVGPAPHGQRYEFITYWPQEPKRRLHNAGGGHWLLGKPCFELDLTQVRSTYGENCGVFPEGPDLYLSYGGNFGPGLGPSSSLFFTGRVTSRAASLEATIDGRPIPVELKPIPAELIRRFRLEEPFSFFISFLPTGIRDGGKLTVTARAADGKLLARQSQELPNLEVQRRGFCALAHKSLRRGTGTKKAALSQIHEFCRPVGDR